MKFVSLEYYEYTEIYLVHYLFICRRGLHYTVLIIKNQITLEGLPVCSSHSFSHGLFNLLVPETVDEGAQQGITDTTLFCSVE